MQPHEWDSDTLCWMEEARHKRPHTSFIWFLLYEISRKGKNRDWKQMIGYLELELGVGTDCEWI